MIHSPPVAPSADPRPDTPAPDALAPDTLSAPGGRQGDVIADSRMVLAPGAATREVELKLALPRAAMKRLPTLPLLTRMAEGEAHTHHVVTVYHDTPDLALARAGLALRLRRQDGRAVQTLKTMAGDTAAGAAVRREWEWELPPDATTPDLAGVRALVDLPPLPDGALDGLAPVFTTDIHRTRLLLHPDPHTVVELALDRGMVVLEAPSPPPSRGGLREAKRHGQVMPVAELELELVSGRVATLYALAAALHRHTPLRLTARSKADAGLALLTGKPHRALPAPAHALTPAISGADAVRHLMRLGLGSLLANADTVAETGDPAAVCEMARAARRLAHTLRLFHRLTGDLEAAELARRLKPLRRRLEVAHAPARTTEALIRHAPSILGRRRRKSLDAAREDGVRRLRRYIRHRDHTALLLDLAVWTEGGGWSQAALESPLRALLPAPLDQLAAACRLAGRRLDTGRTLNDRALSILRRRTTRLALLADMAQGLFPGPRAGAWLGALNRVRRALNDLCALRGGETAGTRTLARTERRLTLDLARAWGLWAACPAFWPDGDGAAAS